jgi:hypothetical protein
MQLYIDPNDGTVRHPDGTEVGTASGDGPYGTNEVKEVVDNAFPADHSSVSVQDLKRVLAVANDDIIYGVP